jgi:PAS domain S-box-containing protein
MENPLKLFERVVGMSIDAVVCADEAGMITLWNKAAEKMFGYAGEEAKGLSIEALIPEKYLLRHRQAMERFLATGATTNIGKITGLTAKKKGGEVFPIDLSLSAERDDNGWVFTAIIRDMTERKALEEALMQRVLELDRLTRAMVGREHRMAELRREIIELKGGLKKL